MHGEMILFEHELLNKEYGSIMIVLSEITVPALHSYMEWTGLLGKREKSLWVRWR